MAGLFRVAAAALAALLIAAWSPAAGRGAVATAQEPLVTAPFFDDAGTQVGSVSVLAIDDPWESPGASLAAPEGSRYVALTVMVEADMGTRMEFGSRSVAAQDTDGRVVSAGYLPVADDALVPAIEDVSLAPGSRIIGLIGFAMSDEADIARLWFTPTWNQLQPFANLGAAADPVAGDAVEVRDQNDAVAQVVVTSIEMPFTAFAEGSAYDDGTVPALVTLSFENTGTGPFSIASGQIVLYDREGNRYDAEQFSRSTDSMRVPNLAGVTLAPGDRATGAVGFRLAEGAEPAWLAFEPETNRFMIVGTIGPDDVTPSPASPDQGAGAGPALPPGGQPTTTPGPAGPAATETPSGTAESAPPRAGGDSGTAESVCVHRSWFVALRSDVAWSVEMLADPAALNYAALPEIIDGFQRRAAQRAIVQAPQDFEGANAAFAGVFLRISQELQDLRNGYASADMGVLDASLSAVSEEHRRLTEALVNLDAAIAACPS